jgi:Cdc6-like AAA superfamily ATPase
MSVRATLPNPFRQRTIDDLWQAPELDLPVLHQLPFEGCCAALAQLRAASQSSSLLLYGEPGNGKSHLLARLISSFNQANASNDYLSGVGWTFFTINLQYVQKMTWRHLQTCMATDLLRVTPA